MNDGTAGNFTGDTLDLSEVSLWTTCAYILGDVNNDGWLDIIVGNFHVDFADDSLDLLGGGGESFVAQ